ncbi:hypothetical protein ACFVU2_01370 [Leifsonia sp. NPDC058194]|uniref:hypothetical protein n=1 Tax=Leifsonia sp. NPDC058194 TaxID=3346374 RepID=UPI0036D9F778
MTTCIRLDFESLAVAAAALAQPPATPLAPAGSIERPALDGALAAVREEWHADAVSGDAVELGSRLTASSDDFRSTEDDAVRTLRALESAFP